MEKHILVTRFSMPSLEEYVKETSPMREGHWLTNMGARCKEFLTKLCDIVLGCRR